MFNFLPNQYKGLLSDDEINAANSQGLLNAGAALLSASGPSQNPMNLAQALGLGLQGYAQGRQGVMDNSLKMKMFQHQLQKDDETELTKNARASGLQPGTPQFNDFIANHYRNQGRGDYFVPVQTAQGTFAFNSRTGKYHDPTSGSEVTKPVIAAPNDPDLQRKLSGAKKLGDIEGETSGNANVKKPQQAKDMSILLDEADKLIDQSTGSLGGAAVDAAAGSFGYATTGAQASARLKVIQAGLMTNMPRMEGPQSDRDVELYRQAAGQIGDPTVPNQIKKAASETIRTINDKYAKRTPPGSTVTTPKSSSQNVRRYNPKTGKIE